jgi:hypothetical protein
MLKEEKNRDIDEEKKRKEILKRTISSDLKKRKPFFTEIKGEGLLFLIFYINLRG